MSQNDLLSPRSDTDSFFSFLFLNHGGNGLVQIILHLIWSVAWFTNTSSTKHCSEINAFLETVFVDMQRRTAPRRLGECSQSRLVWLCMTKSIASKQIWRMFRDASSTERDLRLPLSSLLSTGWSEFFPQVGEKWKYNSTSNVPRCFVILKARIWFLY